MAHIRIPKVAVVESQALKTSSLHARDYVFSSAKNARELVDHLLEANPGMSRTKWVRDFEEKLTARLDYAHAAGAMDGKASLSRKL